MATSGGPRLEGIGRSSNNLVLNLDSTLAASYPGDPVTNIYGDISSSSSLRPSRTEYNTSAGWRSVAGVPMCPDPTVGRIYKHTSGSLTSSWSGNSYGYTLKDLTTDSGSTYILTCWVYVSEDSNLTYLPCTIEQATSHAPVTNYPQYYEMDRKGTWQLIARKCVADAQVRFIPIYPQRVGVTDGSFSGFYLWGGASVVKADYVTPYVLSSRSTTDGFKDLSKNANDGNLINGLSTGVSSYRDGSIIYVGNMFAGDNATLSKSSNYLDFDGSDDYLDGPTVAPNIGAFTYEAVIYRTSSDFLAVGTGTALGGSTYMQFYIYDAGMRVNLYAPQGIGGGWRTGSTIPNTSNTFVNNNIYHITVVNDGTVFYFYKNGVSLGSYDHSYLSNTSSTRLGILRNHVQSVGGTGRVYFARMYNKVLTAAEIKSNFNQLRGRFGL